MTLQNILETAEVCWEKSMRSYKEIGQPAAITNTKGTEYFETSGETRLRIRTKNLPAQTPTHNTEMLQSVLLYADLSSLMADQTQTESLQTFFAFPPMLFWKNCRICLK